MPERVSKGRGRGKEELVYPTSFFLPHKPGYSYGHSPLVFRPRTIRLVEVRFQRSARQVWGYSSLAGELLENEINTERRGQNL